MIIDFEDLQMKPLLYELITQTILPVNDFTMNISEGDSFDISFNNNLFRDYKLLVTNVSFTSLDKVRPVDVSKNGFIYRPAFINFMKSSKDIEEDDSVVKLDFKLVENRL